MQKTFLLFVVFLLLSGVKSFAQTYTDANEKLVIEK